MSTIVEHARKLSIERLFEIPTFSTCWTTWKPIITRSICMPPNPANIINLGDRLAEIFDSTKSLTSARDQSDVSAGGYAWEALVCYYLNLCLIGSRVVVFKQIKSLIPKPISEAITVHYGTFPSNTESDLIAIVFPETPDFTMETTRLGVVDDLGNPVRLTNNVGRFLYKDVIDILVANNFNQIEVGIVQCKTNWNDNAQIPMLWDMIYSARTFVSGKVIVGNTNYKIEGLKKFTYSFVTAPTVKLDKFNTTSTAVQRVRNLSGGNYWGNLGKVGVANSLKEIFGKNFDTGYAGGLLANLRLNIGRLSSDSVYFNIL